MKEIVPNNRRKKEREMKKKKGGEGSFGARKLEMITHIFWTYTRLF